MVLDERGLKGINVGLIAAIILQIFFNFIAAKIESIVNDMEDASISFMDILAKYNNK